MNLPLSAFPADFTRLPTVSFLIPNEAHDIHSGTVAAADSWLAGAAPEIAGRGQVLGVAGKREPGFEQGSPQVRPREALRARV
ncbi:MAG: alkaline phosphatase family protein, partial [Actinomycetota bacterium]|nr:alkaline phosphatase family protein [Actinomycetota bacterium]